MTYRLTDALGSTVNLCGASGNVLVTYTYDAVGNRKTLVTGAGTTTCSGWQPCVTGIQESAVILLSYRSETACGRKHVASWRSGSPLPPAKA